MKKTKQISRVEYYKRLIKSLKTNISLPCWLEYESNGTYYDEYDAYSHPESMTTESNFVICVRIDGIHEPLRVPERSFDKYYLPMFVYQNKGAVEYREDDVNTSIFNIKYILMYLFRDNFLTPKSE